VGVAQKQKNKFSWWGWHKKRKKKFSWWGWHKNEKEILMVGVAQKRTKTKTQTQTQKQISRTTLKMGKVRLYLVITTKI
jgi:hypothetical protein